MQLLELATPLLSNILGFLVPKEDGLNTSSGHLKDLANALVTCKVLRQAGEGTTLEASLVMSTRKLTQAWEEGLEEELLAWLSRRAHLWYRTVVEVASLGSLRLLFSALAATGGTGVRRLQLCYGTKDAECWSQRNQYFCLPEELEQLTSLTDLSIQCEPLHLIGGLPASDLARLSSLSALRLLELRCSLTGLLPPEAISSMQQLISLRWEVYPPPGPNEWVDDTLDDDEWEPPAKEAFPGMQPLALCTALQHLSIVARDPVPPMSAEQVLSAWPRLRALRLQGERPWSSQPFTQNAGFWQGVARLPYLTRLYASNVTGVASQVLSTGLPPRLAVLQLQHYSASALPPLPPTLTWLDVSAAPRTNGSWVLPAVLSPLRVLSLSYHWLCPVSLHNVSAMVQLTALRLWSYNVPERLPALLATLSALETLSLPYNQLWRLPRDLACLPSLRKLDLEGNYLSRVPVELGGRLQAACSTCICAVTRS